jgi:hypothetical protein
MTPSPLVRPTGSAPRVSPIERGVPIPPRRLRRCELRDALGRLGIGDSFVTARTHQAVDWHVRRLGIKVTRRTLATGALRVWRTA